MQLDLMALLAIFSALIATFAAITLWLLGASCQSEVESRFPEYARRIFRPPHQVLQRQGGPVRAWALLTVPMPFPRSATVIQMRALAAVLVASSVCTVGLWVLS